MPSLEVGPAFGGTHAQFRLRGVGFQDDATNNTSAVTEYVDEVALPLPVQTQGLLFDMDRVDVLRGPQGTLCGGDRRRRRPAGPPLEPSASAGSSAGP